MIAGLDKREVDGFMTYTRPEGKSGGHGVGWSEIPKYTFKVPQGWQETPVSIADLGGTEVDHPALICTAVPMHQMPLWVAEVAKAYPAFGIILNAPVLDGAWLAFFL